MKCSKCKSVNRYFLQLWTVLDLPLLTNICVNFVIFIQREYPEKIIKIEFFSFYTHDGWVVLILLYKMNVHILCCLVYGYMFIADCAVCWITYCIMNLLHAIWVTQNLNLLQLRIFDSHLHCCRRVSVEVTVFECEGNIGSFCVGRYRFARDRAVMGSLIQCLLSILPPKWRCIGWADISYVSSEQTFSEQN